MVGIAFLFISVGVLCAQAQTSRPKKPESQKFPECGETNPNGYFIDDSEPENPGPFHDLTERELIQLREFLQNEPTIRAARSSNATINSSYIFTADLHLPKKQEVLNFLDKGGPRPERKAHVIMFRGDLDVPVVEELICGPLPTITKCELLNKPNKRNPVEFSVRPLNGIEIKQVKEVLLKKVDEKIGFILKESYGALFTECDNKEDCLASSSSPLGTGIHGDINKRLFWVNAMFRLKYPSVHQLDMALLVDLSDTDPDRWTVQKVWYANEAFTSLDDLVAKYNSNSFPKTRVTKPLDDESLFSSLRLRSDPQPPQPHRPPRLVEPDGKRYTVKEKKVEYLGWEFYYRLSALNGPAIYDLRFKGERIAYEIALLEIATIYSGFAPYGQTLNEIEGSRMIGSRSRAVIPGAGCPETGNSLSSTFMNQYEEDPAVYNSSWCIFENNNGHPLRRHLSYETEEGGFYGGMLDSALTLRSAVAVLGNDYIIDHIFHQNGVYETKMMSTGYVQNSFFSPEEKRYGHLIQDKRIGNHHQHLFHIKADLDISGTSNRYETLEISKETVPLTAFLDQPFSQTKINISLKETEKEAINDFKFDSPKYHIVHNNEKRNKYDESRAYRIDMQGMSKTKVQENLGNEKSFSWARHQMVVTKHKDEERYSSSIYAMLDSKKPAVNFNSYYEDDENIVDEDLIFWVTASYHHIPRSEDLPNIPTVGNHLSLTLVPHNFFPECPSMASRDAIYIDYKDPKDPSKGVKVERNGNSRDQCVVPRPTLEEDLEEDPDRVLESRRRNPTDF